MPKIHKIVRGKNAVGWPPPNPASPCANVDKAAREVIENLAMENTLPIAPVMALAWKVTKPLHARRQYAIT